MAKKLTLKFKNQQFQTDAARAVTDVFRGQRNQSMVEFTHDMGRSSDGSQDLFDVVGFLQSTAYCPRRTDIGKHPTDTNGGTTAAIGNNRYCRPTPDHRNGDGNGQNLYLHQDHV